MAVSDIGLARVSAIETNWANGTYTSYKTSTLNLNDGETGKLVLIWHSVYGDEINDGWDIAVNWKYMKDSTCEWSEWQTDWMTCVCKDSGNMLSISDTHEQRFNGKSGVYFYYDLQSLLKSSGISTSAAIYKTAAGTYSSRAYDAFKLGIHIKSQMDNGDHSERTDVTLQINWAPIYALTGANWSDASTVAITYTCDGWTRGDDRWELQTLGDCVGSVKPWGYVSAKKNGGGGTIYVPVNELAKAPATNKSLSYKMRYNAAWNANGTTWANQPENTFTMKSYGVSTPVVTVTVQQDGTLKVKVSSAKDMSIEPTSYTVKVGGDEHAYTVDMQTITGSSGTCYFYFAPSAGEVTVIGANGDLTSDTATVEYDSGKTGTYRLYAIDYPEAGYAEPTYNVILQENYEREQVTAKFAGRKRKSVFLGVGGERSLTLSFVVPRVDLNDGLEDHDTQLSVWRAFPDLGICMFYRMDGTRVAVMVDSVDVTRSYNTAMSDVVLNMTECDA